MGYKSFEELAEEAGSSGFSSSNPAEASVMKVTNDGVGRSGVIKQGSPWTYRNPLIGRTLGDVFGFWGNLLKSLVVPTNDSRFHIRGIGNYSIPADYNYIDAIRNSLSGITQGGINKYILPYTKSSEDSNTQKSVSTDETPVYRATEEELEQIPIKVFDQLTGQYVPHGEYLKIHGLDNDSTTTSVPVNIPAQVQTKKTAPKQVASSVEQEANSSQVIPKYEPLPPLQTKVFTPNTGEIFGGLNFNGQPVTVSTWKPNGNLAPLQTKTFAPTDEDIWRNATFNGQPVSVPIRKNEVVNTTSRSEPTLEELMNKWKREGDADYDAARNQYEEETWNDMLAGFGDANNDTQEPSIEELLAQQEEEYNRRYARMGLNTADRLKYLRYAPIVGSMMEMVNKNNLVDADPYIDQYNRTLANSRVSTDPMMPLVRYDRYDPTFEAARQKSSEAQAVRMMSQVYGNRPGLAAGAIGNLFQKGNEAAGELYRKGQMYNQDIANAEEQANRARMQEWLQRHNANQQVNAQFAYQTGNMINDIMQSADNMNRQTKFNARQMFYKNLGLLGQDEMNRWNAGVTALNGFESAGGGGYGYRPNPANDYPAIYGDEQNKRERVNE